MIKKKTIRWLVKINDANIMNAAALRDDTSLIRYVYFSN